MSNLSATQTAILRSIFGAAPDKAVCSLEVALRGEKAGAGPMAAVYDLIAREANERRSRTTVFAPLVRLCAYQPGRLVRFPSAVIALLWSALRAAHPTLVGAAETSSLAKTEDPMAAETYDELCLVCAAGLRTQAPE